MTQKRATALLETLRQHGRNVGAIVEAVLRGDAGCARLLDFPAYTEIRPAGVREPDPFLAKQFGEPVVVQALVAAGRPLVVLLAEPMSGAFDYEETAAFLLVTLRPNHTTLDAAGAFARVLSAIKRRELIREEVRYLLDPGDPALEEYRNSLEKSKGGPISG